MSDSSSDSELEMEAPPAENVLINMKEKPAKGKAFKPPSARIIENYEEIDGLEKPKKREMSAAALAKLAEARAKALANRKAKKAGVAKKNPIESAPAPVQKSVEEPQEVPKDEKVKKNAEKKDDKEDTPEEAVHIKKEKKKKVKKPIVIVQQDSSSSSESDEQVIYIKAPRRKSERPRRAPREVYYEEDPRPPPEPPPPPPPDPKKIALDRAYEAMFSPSHGGFNSRRRR